MASQDLPCVVGMQWQAGSPVMPALLLEWKQVPDKRGRPTWWALVAYARESKAHVAIPFSMVVEWVPPSSLVVLPEGRIWPGKKGR